MALMFLSRKRNRRSNINLSHVKVTDLSVGTITPIAMVPVVKGDIMRFSPSTFVQAMAMKAPLVNGFKLCLEYFFAPNRLYHGKLLLDEMDTTSEPSTVVFPSIKPFRYQSPSSGPSFLVPDAEDFVINLPTGDGKVGQIGNNAAVAFYQFAKFSVQPGSLANYMGFPVGWFYSDDGSQEAPVPPLGSDQFDREFFNVTAACAYLDIFLNYYANQQYDYVYTSLYVTTKVSSGSPDPKPGVDYGVPYQQVRIRLSVLQDFVNGLKRAVDPSTYIYDWFDGDGAEYDKLMSWAWLCSPASLMQRSLPPYYLEQWLKTSFVDGIDNVVKVDADSNSVTFTDIRRASHLQRYLELAMAGGSRYSDYEEAQFDVGRVKNYTTPLFLGSDRHFLGSRVIYQTTGFDNSDSPLGSFAGQSSGGDRFKRRSFKFSEDGTFFVMASLVPDTIYYRGLDPQLRRIRLDDLYVPAKDNIGLEPLPVESVDSLPPMLSTAHRNGLIPGTPGTPDPTASYWELTLGRNVSGAPYDQQRALGFVPAWSSMMQCVSRAYGAMEGDLKYWLLAREYGGQSYPMGLPSVIDQVVDVVISNRGGVTDYSPAVSDALRTFFDNLRENSDYTPYVQNHLYNSVFADTSVNAKNFILTLTMDITVNREKSKVNIPSTI